MCDKTNVNHQPKDIRYAILFQYYKHILYFYAEITQLSYSLLSILCNSKNNF